MNCNVVLSVHGIRTRGVWQKDIVPVLVRAGLVPYSLDYDYFGAAALLNRKAREAKVRWLVGEYNRIRQETGDARPSVIAHSFGTLLAATLIERNPQVTFDKVIFAASIVRNDYPWPDILATRQVNFVENDYGGRDVWPRVARWFVGAAGDSGARGFERFDEALDQRRFPGYAHSDYFHHTHFEDNWVPTLVLNKRRIVDILKAATGLAARVLDLPLAKVRANVFVPDRTGDFLRIVPGLHVNMRDEGELALTIPVTLGAINMPGAGDAYATRAPAAVLFAEDWRANVLRGGGAVRANPELQWIVSIPMLDADTGLVLGIVDIDGLQSVKTLAQLSDLAGRLVPFAQEIGRSLAEAQAFL